MIAKRDAMDVMPDTLKPLPARDISLSRSVRKPASWRRLTFFTLFASSLALSPLMPQTLQDAVVSVAQAQSTGANLPRIGDPSGSDLSPSSERRIGESIVRQMISAGQIIEDWELRDYLNRLCAPLMATDAAQGFSFEFYPIRDISINAFALPGGYIGVHAGLFLAAQSESELASVLAHEIAHVTQRHMSRMVSKSKQATVTAIAGAILAALAAASNPQAAAGMVMLGDSVAQDQMLAFSRDAEREADRVGFEMLSQAGFEPGGMFVFFNRLQQANQMTDVGLPVYLRSHPLTTERISDVQARMMVMRYKQRIDSPEFALVKAKLKAIVPSSDNVLGRNPSLLTDEHKRVTRAYFERQTSDKDSSAKAASWYGLSVIRRLSSDAPGARMAIAQARKRMAAPSAMIEGEAIQIELAAGQNEQALKMLETAMRQFPVQRSFVHMKARALLKTDAESATAYLDDQLKLYRADYELWNLLSQVHFDQKRDVAGHRARAEALASLGLWMPAMEQLRIAQRQVRNDYYVGSQIDARLKEFERNFTLDQQARL